MDTVFVAVLIIIAVSLIVVFSLGLEKRTTNNTTTAVLSPSENLSVDVSTDGWRDSSMPWNNCLDANKVYCSEALTRQPGGCMKMRSYPRCGMSCNQGCPEACSSCIQGTCR